MSTFGLKNFENDEAMDFLYEILDNDKNFIVDVLKKVADYPDNEYLEVPDCQQALVASELVAAAKGSPSIDFPSEADEWLVKNKLSEENLSGVALKAIARIKINSELRKLWEESDEFQEWLKVINDLEDRIG